MSFDSTTLTLYSQAMSNTHPTVWERQLGPLLDLVQTQMVLGVRTTKAVTALAERGFLLVLGASGGRKLYPAFQFNSDGTPSPEIARILKIFQDAVETPYTIASWFVSPQDWLNGETPVDWMQSRREPERLYEAARRAAARLDQ